MALAKRCDRCGEFYEPYDKLTPDKSSRVNAIRLASFNSDGTLHLNVRNYDICPYCMDSFFHWLREVVV